MCSSRAPAAERRAQRQALSRPSGIVRDCHSAVKHRDLHGTVTLVAVRHAFAASLALLAPLRHDSLHSASHEHTVYNCARCSTGAVRLQPAPRHIRVLHQPQRQSCVSHIIILIDTIQNVVETSQRSAASQAGHSPSQLGPVLTQGSRASKAKNPT
jgi:hypothetical protein